MITPEERQSIIDEAVEKALLALPDTLTKMVQHTVVRNAAQVKMYADNKDFIPHGKIVASTLEEVEKAHPTLEYEELIKLCVPIVKEKLAIMGTLDTKSADKPQDISINGVI